MKKEKLFSVLITCLVFAGLTTQAASITGGNLVIYRVGDGSAALGTTATSVFLDEYTVAGVLVQSLAVSSSGTSAMTATGNASTEGVISRSQDGNSLVFTGYRANAGAANPSSATYTVANRVIGTLNLAGSVSTATALINDNGATTANTIRSATSVDGSAFWVSTSSRVSYLGTPSGASSTVQIDARNSRQVNMSGNTLFAANGSTSIAGKVQTYGTLPTGATAATPIVSLATANAVNGFVLLDLDSGVAGDDTLYCIDTVANLLLKYTFNGSIWSANGSISASGTANITGIYTGSAVNLYLTSGSTLYGYSDLSGFGGTETGTLASITTAGANTGFRGIGMFAPAPVPEPTTLALGLVGSVGLWIARRRRA